MSEPTDPVVPAGSTQPLAHARATSTADPGHAGVPQVLFVGEHDTGRAQIAAALLAHCAGDSLTVRSAGLLPGTALDPRYLLPISSVQQDGGVLTGRSSA
ncbi:hypothetical protein [Kocuria rosea]|uniref:hypothetical protein n=1 Tax=Kocuria rosea TaxID=1275 RepID=UPI00203CF4EB|nr:hypothetical protein [Kocuria rosea]